MKFTAWTTQHETRLETRWISLRIAGDGLLLQFARETCDRQNLWPHKCLNCFNICAKVQFRPTRTELCDEVLRRSSRTKLSDKALQRRSTTTKTHRSSQTYEITSAKCSWSNRRNGAFKALNKASFIKFANKLLITKIRFQLRLFENLLHWTAISDFIKRHSLTT